MSGYSVRIYGTWMNQKPEGSGPYADTWLMWSRFKNTVSSGNYTDTDTYHSKGFTWSIEGGYTFPLKDWRDDDGTDNAVRLQLQAQMIRMGVRDGTWTDAIGSTVQGIGAGNVRTRVGLKLYHQFTNDAKDRAWKPFIGLNWYHDTKAFGARIAGVADHIDGSRNFGEVKLGVEGKVKKNWNVWGFAGYQQGREGFRNLEALVGMKYLF
ncbi:outer membrane autotransporter barrel domain [Sutterella sp. CAG:351]|nr:outer membrane autotransporter barrel domain [Sutterella sp. CAG:351]